MKLKHVLRKRWRKMFRTCYNMYFTQRGASAKRSACKDWFMRKFMRQISASTPFSHVSGNIIYSSKARLRIAQSPKILRQEEICGLRDAPHIRRHNIILWRRIISTIEHPWISLNKSLRNGRTWCSRHKVANGIISNGRTGVSAYSHLHSAGIFTFKMTS